MEGFLPPPHNLPSFQALTQIKWKEKKEGRKSMVLSPTVPAEGTPLHMVGSREASPEAGGEGGRAPFDVWAAASFPDRGSTMLDALKGPEGGGGCPVPSGL